MKTTIRIAALAWAWSFASIACSTEDDPRDPDRRDLGNGSGTDMGDAPMEPEFERTVLDGLGAMDVNVGNFAVARIAPSGLAAVAYVHQDTTNLRETIHYVEQTGPGTWGAPEEAAFPGNVIEQQTGMDFRGSRILQFGFDFVNGQPQIAHVGGGPSMLISSGFPTDLMRSVRGPGGWSEDPQALVADSNETTEGMPCPEGNQVCDFGDIVGSYVAARAGPGGTFAVAYRDQHQEAEAEVSARADLEVYIEGPGGVRKVLVDPARNAPFRTNVAFTPDGRVVVAYRIQAPPEVFREAAGIWVAVEGDDGSFALHEVSEDVTVHRIGLDVSDSGRIALAYWEQGRSDLVVATSDDDGETWSVERPDQRDDTGLFPDLAFDDLGREVVSYTYCGRAGGGDCPGDLGPDSQVRLARREGGDWAIYTVDDGQGFGNVGTDTNVVVYPDGHLGVTFRDSRNADLVFAEEVTP